MTCKGKSELVRALRTVYISKSWDADLVVSVGELTLIGGHAGEPGSRT